MAFQKYFAYGSNMDCDQMAIRCPESRLVGPGWLRGYRFRINSRGVATVVPDQDAITWGVIWDITVNDRKSLDNYEGVHSGFYYSKIIGIEGTGTQTYDCLIYIASDDTPGKPRENYLERIIAWAKKHGLPQDYIDRELSPWLRK